MALMVLQTAVAVVVALGYLAEMQPLGLMVAKVVTA
jgi:hypothetical protein